jgi:hypothetical protein
MEENCNDLGFSVCRKFCSVCELDMICLEKKLLLFLLKLYFKVFHLRLKFVRRTGFRGRRSPQRREAERSEFFCSFSLE